MPPEGGIKLGCGKHADLWVSKEGGVPSLESQQFRHLFALSPA
ncbi:hypothetical protein EDD53_0024 [Pacificibacter maritimus]|uniref:Uncharacterized protein n=1 Tax=Pacificibacter maritimus TaxID=762213 RepID=A0A3N4VD97_9RHOB|nr:hypothetical protein EDD53_0024 [Pacificibacter maritimus]